MKGRKMGRKPTVNLNLPKGIRARKRTRKNGVVVTYYFYDSRTPDGKRKEIPLGTDYVLAVQEWAKLEAEKIPQGSEATLGTVVERYKVGVLPKNAKGTQGQKLQHLKKLIQFFGADAPLAAIEPKHIRQYLDFRQSAPKLANNEIATFSNIWNCAREWGYTDRENPCRGVKRYPTGKRKVYVEDQIYELVYQAADEQIRDMMDIAYLIGQRPVDVVKLHSDHIYNGILHITQQKTKTQQQFEIVGKLAEIINRRLPANGGYLFCNKWGNQLKRQTLSTWFRELREKLMEEHPELKYELNTFQFRDLRAKSATDIFLASSLEDASKQLGHKSENMTLTYIRKVRTQQPLCGTPVKVAEKSNR